MRQITVGLPYDLNQWVSDNIVHDNRLHASDYITALIRQDRDRVEALREAIIEGENSGPTEPFDIENFLKDMKADNTHDHAATQTQSSAGFGRNLEL